MLMRPYRTMSLVVAFIRSAKHQPSQDQNINASLLRDINIVSHVVLMTRQQFKK